MPWDYQHFFASILFVFFFMGVRDTLVIYLVRFTNESRPCSLFIDRNRLVSWLLPQYLVLVCDY